MVILDFIFILCQVRLHQLIHPGLHRLLHPRVGGRRLLLVHHRSAGYHRISGAVCFVRLKKSENDLILNSMILVVGMQDLLRATEYTGASGVYAIRCTYLDTCYSAPQVLPGNTGILSQVLPDWAANGG